ncbi:MAG: helix-turn-helix transcriptional regulator [Solirubrobacterales bacterium]|nr:helix-turn-helix transcriptional regulator [Solirubrobacterales bacterium]
MTYPMNKTPSAAFGHRMRRLRVARGWSIRDIAEKLVEVGHPANEATIHRTETGKRRVTLDEAIPIAAVLGTTVTALVALGPTWEELVIEQSKLSPEESEQRWRDEEVRQQERSQLEVEHE